MSELLFRLISNGALGVEISYYMATQKEASVRACKPSINKTQTKHSLTCYFIAYLTYLPSIYCLIHQLPSFFLLAIYPLCLGSLLMNFLPPALPLNSRHLLHLLQVETTTEVFTTCFRVNHALFSLLRCQYLYVRRWSSHISTAQDALTVTYDHIHLKTRDPVRSPIDKQVRARLVLGWVTTGESLVLYVFLLVHLYACGYSCYATHFI